MIPRMTVYNTKKHYIASIHLLNLFLKFNLADKEDFKNIYRHYYPYYYEP